MKKISKEFVQNYKNYSFGYGNYCLKEKGDKNSDIYRQGYLPYSGSPKIKDTFYMARSSRVSLKGFELSSENRRIAKKFDGTLKRNTYKIKDFTGIKKDFIPFCVKYFSKRHGPDVMPEERINTLINSGLVDDIIYYTDNKGDVKAYVLEVREGDMVHFWFSFYDISLIFQSLGMWLMLDSLRVAKKEGAKYFYTGTVYGEKALYKIAFKGIEYWDGTEWIQNTKELKILARTDNERFVAGIDALKKDIKIF